MKESGKLSGTEFTVGSDYMEVGSFIGLAGATGSEIELHGLQINDLRMIEKGFERIGITWRTTSETSILIPKEQVEGDEKEYLRVYAQD